MEKQWKCPKPLCASVRPVEEIYREVRAFLEQIDIDCPGCNLTLPYEKAFTHVQSCNLVDKKYKLDASEMKTKVENIKKTRQAAPLV